MFTSTSNQQRALVACSPHNLHALLFTSARECMHAGPDLVASVLVACMTLMRNDLTSVKTCSPL